jgi:hypothetical protein
MAHRWRGYKHPELYTMINAGPGSAASDPQTTYWQDLSEELSLVDEALNGKLATLGARWEGAAADSANSGLTPLAAWAGDAETGSTIMKISTENQGEYIADARARMPEPVKVTTPAPSTWDVVTAGASALTGNPGPAVAVAAQAVDHEMQEAAQSEAEQRAVATMETYESSSTWNRETLGTFVAPPDVVVSTPEPQGGSGTAVLYNPKSSKNVATNGTGTSGVEHTTPTGTHVDTVQQPGGVTQGGGTHPAPTTGTGGGVHTPPSVTVPPGTTSPSGGGLVLPGGNTALPTPPSGPPALPPTNPGTGFPPGGGPFPAIGGGDLSAGGGNNASDIARRALPPVRGGFPAGSGPLGGGGLSGGGGGFAGGLDGERSPSQLGRGGFSGVPGEGGVVRNAPGAAGAAGRPGGGVNGPVGPGGRRADGEDDDEHFSPDYLLEIDDVFGDDRRVSPTVIGEMPPE